MKGQLIILSGISGSGKSTYAHELWKSDPDHYVIVNRDKVRELLFGFTESSVEEYYRMEKLGKYEKQVTRYCDTLINDGLNHGKTVIIDSTNLTKKYIEAFKYWNVPTEVILFSVDLKVAIERDLLRSRQVGQDVIERQYARFKTLENYFVSNQIDFTPVTINMNADNESCVIFDIDGTLAHMNDRMPYDWHKVGEDTLDIPTSIMSYSLNELGVKIIICTGRDGVCEDETIDWLEYHQIPYDKLFIRQEGDMRPDWVVKEEMWRKIAEDYYIEGMFDDRLQVVRRARALGLKVFNVEYGNF